MQKPSVVTETYNPTDIAYSGNAGTDGLGGLSIKTKSTGKLIEKKWLLLGGVAIAAGSIAQTVGVNAVVDTEFVTLLAADGVTRQKMTAKKYVYDYNGELLQTIEYDWFAPDTVTYNPSGNQSGMPTAVPGGATVLRVIDNDYHNEADDGYSSNAYFSRTVGTGTVLLGKLKETTVGDGTAVKSRTRFSYDGQAYGTAPTLGMLRRQAPITMFPTLGSIPFRRTVRGEMLRRRRTLKVMLPR